MLFQTSFTHSDGRNRKSLIEISFLNKNNNIKMYIHWHYIKNKLANGTINCEWGCFAPYHRGIVIEKKNNNYRVYSILIHEKLPDKIELFYSDIKFNEIKKFNLKIKNGINNLNKIKLNYLKEPYRSTGSLNIDIKLYFYKKIDVQLTQDVRSDYIKNYHDKLWEIFKIVESFNNHCKEKAISYSKMNRNPY